MVLISDNESFHDEFNVDDKLGERIDIPTIVILKKDGGSIVKYIKENPLNKVIMSIKFVAVQESGKIEMKLFMRSDDVKALHFFKEFRQFYTELCN
jgi:hypothetical protein